MKRWMELPWGPHAVSKVVANIYMEMFEELALRTATHPPQIYRRLLKNQNRRALNTHQLVFLKMKNSAKLQMNDESTLICLQQIYLIDIMERILLPKHLVEILYRV